MNASDSLSRAISYLGAVEVADADGKPWYAWQPEKDCWMLATSFELEQLAEKLDDEDDDNPPPLPGVEMPLWWTPEQRFGYHVIDPEGTITYTGAWITDEPMLESRERADGWRVQRITASLETGKEIPA